LTAQPPRAVSFTHSSALTISDNSKEVIDIDDDDVDHSYFGSSPNPDPGDYSPGDIINVKTTGMSLVSSSSPRKKRAKSSPTKDFTARTVNHVSSRMLEGSPATQNAALRVLEELSMAGNNVSKVIVASKTASGNPSQGMSQDVCQLLLHSKKLSSKKSG